MRISNLIIAFLVMVISLLLLTKHYCSALELIKEGDKWNFLVYEYSPLNRSMELLDTTQEQGLEEWKVLQHQQRKGLSKSLECFEQLLENHPQSTFVDRARWNAGLICTKLGQQDKAIDYYTTILSGASITYKNKACQKLAAIYLQKENYQQALTTIQLTEQYPCQSSCGTGALENLDQINQLQIRCYRGLEQYEKALSLCLPYAIGYLEDSTVWAHTAAVLLRETYEQKLLLEELELAIDKVYLKGEDKDFADYCIHYKGEEVELPFLIIEEGEPLIAAARKRIKASYFYQLLEAEAQPQLLTIGKKPNRPQFSFQ